MKKKCLILYKAIIVAIFIGVTCVANAQQSLSAEEYSQTVWKLADELKDKLNEVQRSNEIWKLNWQKYPEEQKLWGAAEYALEDLKNVRYFYLHPNVLSLDWDIETTRAARTKEILSVRPKRPSSDSHQTLTKIIVKDGKSFYIEGTLPGLHPSKYRETTTISFYDPSSRKIQCCGTILPFDQLKELIKTSQIKIVSKRGSKPFLDMTGSSTNGGMGAAYVDVADSWLLKSSYTNEVVNLPFGTFWTSTPNDGGLKCITVDVYATHAYEETSMNKSEEALCLYAFGIDYTQLLNWYKESLDYIMRDVNKLIGEQEAKEKAKEDAFDEADKKEPLAMLLIGTASVIKSDRSLFDYVITETSTTYEINIIANTNTIRFAKEFWNKLKHLNDPKGNIPLYYFGQRGPGDYSYKVATSNEENKTHIKKLLNKIVDNSKSSIYVFVKSHFRGSSQDCLTIQNCNDFRIHGVNGDSRYGDKGVDIPCLDLYMEKGSVLYSVSISKDIVSLLNNTKDTGYKVKVKK